MLAFLLLLGGGDGVGEVTGGERVKGSMSPLDGRPISPQRNRMNWIMGWAVSLVTVAGLIAIDPLGVRELIPGENQFDAENMRFVILLAAISLGSYTFLVRPVVYARGDDLCVRNPFREWRIPKRLIETIDASSSRYVRIRAGGKRIPVVALEVSNLGYILGYHGMDSKAERVAGYLESSRSTEAESRIEVRWLVPDWIQFALVSVFVAYSLLGFLMGRL